MFACPFGDGAPQREAFGEKFEQTRPESADERGQQAVDHLPTVTGSLPSSSQPGPTALAPRAPAPTQMARVPSSGLPDIAALSHAFL